MRRNGPMPKQMIHLLFTRWAILSKLKLVIYFPEWYCFHLLNMSVSLLNTLPWNKILNEFGCSFVNSITDNSQMLWSFNQVQLLCHCRFLFPVLCTLSALIFKLKILRITMGLLLEKLSYSGPHANLYVLVHFSCRLNTIKLFFCMQVCISYKVHWSSTWWW